MKPRGRSLGWTIGLLAALTLMAGAPCGAAPSPATALAAVTAGPSEVSWSPQTGNFESLVLTVSAPDGTVFRREFAAGVTPTFSLFDAAGSLRQDGVYHYELRALPKVSAALRQQMAAARSEGGGTTLGHPVGALPDLVQSGSFAIQDGALITAGKPETPSDSGLQKVSAAGINKVTAEGTILTNSDGIIHNSLCVGFDCPTSPTFSDTTILLMENNTRIKFDDTSTISGFPNRDWSINANDSASGGSNRFWVQDCGNSSQGGCSGNAVFSIEAGARNNALYVDNTGRLGLGTSNPVVDVHTTRGDTPTLRLEQNGSSGFAPQTWDVAGNETSFFIRDATNGSTLPFRIRPGAPSSSIDIAANGNVGFGTGSPANAVTVEKSTNSFMRFNRTSSGSGWIFGIAESPVDDFVISLAGSGQSEFLLDSSGNLTIPGSLHAMGSTFPSSRVLKENFQPIDGKEMLRRLMEIPIEEWNYKADKKATPHIGPIAEDFHAAFDMLAPAKTLNVIDLNGIAFAAIQGLYQEIQARDRKFNELEARNADLEAKNTALEARNADLEKQRDQQLKDLKARLSALEALARDLRPAHNTP